MLISMMQALMSWGERIEVAPPPVIPLDQGRLGAVQAVHYKIQNRYRGRLPTVPVSYVPAQYTGTIQATGTIGN